MLKEKREWEEKGEAFEKREVGATAAAPHKPKRKWKDFICSSWPPFYQPLDGGHLGPPSTCPPLPILSPSGSGDKHIKYWTRKTLPTGAPKGDSFRRMKAKLTNDTLILHLGMAWQNAPGSKLFTCKESQKRHPIRFSEYGL